MKNTLNPCRCGSGEGAEFASQITYDGNSIECLSGAVGQNLAVLLKRMGDLVCDNSPPVISWEESTIPSDENGSNGDIYFNEKPDAIDLYQKVDDEWELLGSFRKGNLYVEDNDFTVGISTSAQLDTKYPNAIAGDVVWSEVNKSKFEKMGSGKWSAQIIEIV